MKYQAYIAFILLICILGSQLLSAQYQIGLVPRSSPDREVYQKVGLTDIRITYGSPSVQGRRIWGELEPYDEVWRAGANNATTIEFSADVEIEGQLLKKGIYSFFLIPRKEKKWIAIFNKNPKQWGAFSYQQAEDALRVEVDFTEGENFQEKLIYDIEQIDFNTAFLYLKWEKIEIKLQLSTQYTQQFIATVKSRVAQAPQEIKWVVYLQGAEHLWEMQDSLELALEWVQQSRNLSQYEGEWNKQYYPKEYILGHLNWLAAQLYQQRGESEKSCALLGEVKSTMFYTKKQEEIDRVSKKWEVNCKEE